MQGRLLCKTMGSIRSFTEPAAAGHFQGTANFEGDDYDPASTDY